MPESFSLSLTKSVFRRKICTQFFEKENILHSKIKIFTLKRLGIKKALLSEELEFYFLNLFISSNVGEETLVPCLVVDIDAAKQAKFSDVLLISFPWASW